MVVSFRCASSLLFIDRIAYHLASRPPRLCGIFEVLFRLPFAVLNPSFSKWHKEKINFFHGKCRTSEPSYLCVWWCLPPISTKLCLSYLQSTVMLFLVKLSTTLLDFFFLPTYWATFAVCGWLTLVPDTLFFLQSSKIQDGNFAHRAKVSDHLGEFQKTTIIVSLTI